MGAKSLDSLNGPARGLLEQAMGWMDERWDAAAGLLAATPDDAYSDHQSNLTVHVVRESSQYALGLLMRGQHDDAERAFRTLAAVLAWQFDEPEQPYHGTWWRAPEEPHPPVNPVVWRDYDPNWREFIGTVLAIILLEYEPLLPSDLVMQIDNALRKAIAGTLARDLPSTYTNIALMQAFLLRFGADRFHEPAWSTRAEQRAEEIYQLFTIHNAFWEYNSPTYYGVDLYALALWRSYSTSPVLRERGAAMEAELWRDIAQFYHADLCNVAGPYDRSYGMDMQRYVACLGLWIYLAVGRERAPVPDLTQPFAHAWDICMVPNYAILGVRIPDDAQPHFQAFQGDRLVEHVISDEPRRVATAWLGRTIMLGSEDVGGQRHPSGQFHPATIHWLQPDGTVGWVRLLYTTPADAHADASTLSLTFTDQEAATKDIVFLIAAAPLASHAITATEWQLPGLTIHVETNAQAPQITSNDTGLELRYTHRNHRNTPIRFTLRTEPS